jgi:hypothetical protein
MKRMMSRRARWCSLVLALGAACSASHVARAPDAGAVSSDAGEAGLDASASTDSGARTDAGTRTDAGARADAGTRTDAGRRDAAVDAAEADGAVGCTLGATRCAGELRAERCAATGHWHATDCDAVLGESCGPEGVCVGMGLQILGEREFAGAEVIDTAFVSLWVTRVVNSGPKSVDVRQLCTLAEPAVGGAKGVIYADDDGVPGAMLLHAAGWLSLEEDGSVCYFPVGGAQIAPGQAVWIGAQLDGPIEGPPRIYSITRPEGDSYWTGSASPVPYPPDSYPLASPNTTHLPGVQLSFFAVVFPLAN